MARLLLSTVALSACLVLAACTDAPPAAPANVSSLPPGGAADEDDEDLTVPIAGLTSSELARFNAGQLVFARVFTDGNGLGPSFNSNSCAGCHEEPSVGGIGDDLGEDVETHVSRLNGSTCDDLTADGGAVIQQSTTALLQSYYPAILQEAVPAQAIGIGRRTTPAVFGFGLLDAIPDATILALEDPNDANGDGVSGRAHMVNGKVGKFGRKATDPTLLEFNAGAFLMEMGITNLLAGTEQPIAGVPYPFSSSIDPAADPELSSSDVALANDFVRFLAPPSQEFLSLEAKGGKELFLSIGCATCHVPNLQTGDSPVRALRYRSVAAFTDLLLHDIGTGTGDICRGGATAGEFRTEPLMGLRFREVFLHDASATTLEAAIAAHQGEATSSRNKFDQLKANQKAAVLAYLSSL